ALVVAGAWQSHADQLEDRAPCSRLAKLVIGELDLVPEDVLRIDQRVGDTTCCKVGGEQAVVQGVDHLKRRKAQLPGLQNHIATVPLNEPLSLLLVGPEQADLAVLVLDLVQRVEPVPLIAQRLDQVLLVCELAVAVHPQISITNSDHDGAGAHSSATSASSSSSDLPAVLPAPSSSRP